MIEPSLESAVRVIDAAIARRDIPGAVALIRWKGDVISAIRSAFHDPVSDAVARPPRLARRRSDAVNRERRADLVVVGAHPLDAEILGGAVAAQLAQRGSRCVLGHLTDGAGNYPALGPEASSHEARREAEEAAALLGSELCWLGIPSKDLRTSASCRDALARRLEIWQPRAVITHWRGSWHERHRIAHRLVLGAVTAVDVPIRVYYGENFEDLDGFLPTLYVDIGDVCGRWWRALESYRLVRDSQSIGPEDHITFPYYSYYRAVPRVRGLECGLPLAQGFAVRGQRRRQKTVGRFP